MITVPELIESENNEMSPTEIPVMVYLAENSPVENIDIVRFMRIPEKLSKGRNTYILTIQGDYIL